MKHTSPQFLIILSALTFALSSGLEAEPILGSPTSSSAATEPYLAIEVDNAILQLKLGTPVSTGIRVKPLNFPMNSALTYEWRQIQDEMTPGAVPIAKRPITFGATDRSEITAKFNAAGVYVIRLTVTDTRNKLSVSRNTWINVWDDRSPIMVDGKPDPLAVIPGMNPPKVRNLSPDPGPFRHPRLFCTNAEWQDIHDRCVGGRSKIAAKAWELLTYHYDSGIKPKSPDDLFLAQIEAYADSGWKAPVPDLTRGKPDAKSYEVQLYELCHSLGQASFVQWVKHNPSLPTSQVSVADQEICRRLAKQVAALSRLILDAQWNAQTGEFKTGQPGFLRGFDVIGERTANISGLALAYDFISPWMTLGQQRITRNLLIAAGRGRKGDGQRVGHSLAKDRWVERGYRQNGNFPSVGELNLLTGLVVSGEEPGADEAVVKAFTAPPPPVGYAASKGPSGYDHVQPVHVDTGRDQPLSRPFPETITWPHARKADVNNLQRQIWSWQDAHISPWGFTLERIAYFGSMTDEVWPMAVVYARFGGFNQYVGCYFYQTVNNLIYTQYASGGADASKSFTSHIGMYEHHSGGGDYRQQHILLLKYMYPEDPLVDYAYATQAPQIEKRVRQPLHTCIFGLDPKVADLRGALAPIAVAKQLPLTKLDPQEGIVVMRSGWADEDLMLYLDAGYNTWGHMNAERSAFSFFALGRHWAVPTGFHKTYSNFQSLIQVQNPAWAACPVTQGYMGVNPSFTPEVPGCDYYPGFPTPSARLLETRESPDQLWSVAACDATSSYNFICGAPQGKPETLVSQAWSGYMYPGWASALAEINPGHPSLAEPTRKSVSPTASDTIQHAIRSVLSVRGSRSYALIVDDFRKNDAPANYRWMMSDKTKMKDEGRATGPDGEAFCVIMASGATSTDAVLLHRRDQGEESGKPRLLVRDVSEADNVNQPAIRMDLTSFKLGEEKYSNEDTNRLFIERNQVVEPRYKVLLFPYRTGEPLPKTSWDGNKKTLTVDLGNGAVDVITFARNETDHRTRLSLTRASKQPPLDQPK